ncbi:hypothetical protein [Agarivorans sp. DSG3-1]|uniref:hypothetical protein n=1 Tax=Agarivorans sp. DSG3-1 TaxID=3342249 RepID=UPI00398E5E06
MRYLVVSSLFCIITTPQVEAADPFTASYVEASKVHEIYRKEQSYWKDKIAKSDHPPENETKRQGKRIELEGKQAELQKKRIELLGKQTELLGKQTELLGTNIDPTAIPQLNEDITQLNEDIAQLNEDIIPLNKDISNLSDYINSPEKSLADDALNSGEFQFFRFTTEENDDQVGTDSLFGSLMASSAGDTQTIKFDAINYNLHMGGNIHIPFQLYYGNVVSDGDDDKANSIKLMDPENGVALKFPVVFNYFKNESSGGLCAFYDEDKDSVGRCSLGGDLTFNYRELKNDSGESDTQAGYTARLGGAMVFPINNVVGGKEKGFLSLGAKVVYSYANVDDPTNFFTPVLDASGNPVSFDKYIGAADLEVKWVFYEKLSISTRWLLPLNNTDYLEDVFSVSLENKF